MAEAKAGRNTVTNEDEDGKNVPRESEWTTAGYEVSTESEVTFGADADATCPKVQSRPPSSGLPKETEHIWQTPTEDEGRLPPEPEEKNSLFRN